MASGVNPYTGERVPGKTKLSLSFLEELKKLLFSSESTPKAKAALAKVPSRKKKVVPAKVSPKKVVPKKKLTQKADKNNIILKRQLAEDARKKIVASQRLKPKAAPKPNKPKTAPQPKAKSKPQVTPKPKAAPSLDKLSFRKAFNESRDEHGGPGGVFTWRGKKYQTNIKGEDYVKNPKSVWKTKPSVKGGRRFEREKPGERAKAKAKLTQTEKKLRDFASQVEEEWKTTVKNMKTGGKVTNPARIKSTIRMTSGGGVGSKLIDDIYKEKAGFFSEEMPKGKVSQMKKRVVPKPNVKQGVKPYALTDSLRQERALQKILKKKGISMEEFEEQFKDKRTIGDHAKELIKSGKIKKQRFSYSKKGKTAAKRKRKK